ncbi:PAS domain-containing hybrid sensor histidine kinase/response regulator [Marinobacterium litorale]|uniref:PAS domain-containing hybrid sensor histidine kinase/response regulator n=1 Tax=Marinobacterium litorale TaxID=404770 RepID=UPI00040B9910|nr:PAS domain-containing hybrid sensor histidine kinase/response regulator [Marinobacterium litorale]
MDQITNPGKRRLTNVASFLLSLLLGLCILFLLVTNWRLNQLREVQLQLENADNLSVLTEHLALRRGLRAIQGEGDPKVGQELVFIDQLLDERTLQAGRVYRENAAVQSVLRQVRDLTQSTRQTGVSDPIRDFQLHTELIGTILDLLSEPLIPAASMLTARDEQALRYIIHQSKQYHELLGQMRGAISAYMVNLAPDWAAVARSKIEQVEELSPTHHRNLYRLAEDLPTVTDQLHRMEDVALRSEIELINALKRALRQESDLDSTELFYLATRFMDLNGFVDNVFKQEFERQLDAMSARYYRDVLLLIAALAALITGKIVLYTRKLNREKQSTAQLNSTLSMFKRAMDEHAIISITDAKGVITYINQKFREVSGFDESELIGKTHRVINSGFHPPGFFAELWQSALAGKVWTNEVCNRRKDGSLYWVSATVFPQMGEDGKLESIISVRTEITEQKAIERQLQEEKAKADQANRAKSQFLANMSHEIRTPMNAVIGFTHLALRDESTPHTRSYLSKIERAAKGLLAIINDILDLSKIESGKLGIEQTSVNLRDLVDDAVHSVSIRGDRQETVPILTDWDERIPERVRGDPVRVGQVLLNLLSNAVKFTERGEVRVSVRMGAEQGDGCIQVFFYVIDTGIGISQEQKAKLFKPFSQADDSTTRLYGGTGLGLSISKQLVELMGGEIQVQSAPGQGSCFYFSLPFETAGVDAVEAEGAPQSTAAVTKSALLAPPPQPVELTGRRILVVEDNQINQEVIAGLLAPYQASLTLAGDGAQALEQLRAGSFDLVLSDIQMPVMDGREFARRAIEELGDACPPIIAMTAHVSAEEVSLCLEAGMTDHLAKPIEPKRLDAVLGQWLPGMSGSTVDSEAPVSDTSTTIDDETIDVKRGLMMVGGDKALLAAALSVYADTYRHFDFETERCESDDDQRAVHSLKSVGGTLGMQALAVEAVELEKQLKAGSLPTSEEADDFVALVRRWAREAERVQRELLAQE